MLERKKNLIYNSNRFRERYTISWIVYKDTVPQQTIKGGHDNVIR